MPYALLSITGLSPQGEVIYAWAAEHPPAKGDLQQFEEEGPVYRVDERKWIGSTRLVVTLVEVSRAKEAEELMNGKA